MIVNINLALLKYLINCRYDVDVIVYLSIVSNSDH
jgi:hypothetical protein